MKNFFLAISDFWGEIRFLPSLRKNSRKSPSLARRGILKGNVNWVIQSILSFTSEECTRDQTLGKASPEVEVRAHHTCQILLLTSITSIGGCFTWSSHLGCSSGSASACLSPRTPSPWRWSGAWRWWCPPGRARRRCSPQRTTSKCFVRSGILEKRTCFHDWDECLGANPTWRELPRRCRQSKQPLLQANLKVFSSLIKTHN